MVRRNVKLCPRKCSKVEFLQADARSFQLPHKIHAVISVFDSLNHIMSPKELGTVFIRPLQPFAAADFSCRPEYWSRLSLWVDRWFLYHWGWPCRVIRSTYNQKNRTADFDATLFRLEGDSWYRHNFILYRNVMPQRQWNRPSNQPVLPILKPTASTGSPGWVH